MTQSYLGRSTLDESAEGDPMKRTWTIIGVGDVPGSFKWYETLVRSARYPSRRAREFSVSVIGWLQQSSIIMQDQEEESFDS